MSGITLDFERVIGEIGWATVHRSKGSQAKNPKQAAKLCQLLHEKTLLNPHPMIWIGPRLLLENPNLSREYGLVAPEKQNLGGALLGRAHWSTLLNDLFIWTSAQEKKRVHLVWDIEMIEDTDLIIHQKLTTIGRELAILMKLGYRKAQELSEEENQKRKYHLFIPPSTVPAITLSKMWKTLEDVELFALRSFILGLQEDEPHYERMSSHRAD